MQCTLPGTYLPHVPQQEMLWWGQSLCMRQWQHTTYTCCQGRSNCSNCYLSGYFYPMHNLCPQTTRCGLLWYPWGSSTGWQSWFFTDASWWHTCLVNSQSCSGTLPQICNNKCKRKTCPICTIGKSSLWNDEKWFTILPKMGCRSYFSGFHYQSLWPMRCKKNCGWTPIDDWLACWWFTNWSSQAWYGHSIPCLDCKALQHAWQKSHSHLGLISWLSGHKYRLLWSRHGEIWYGSIHQKNYWCFPWKDHRSDFYSSCADHLVAVCPSSEACLLPKDQAWVFHHTTTQLLFLPRVCHDI